MPAERTVTVHEGIDVDRVAAPPVNDEVLLPHDAPVVGNVAALVPHKGQRHLIEAAHLVVQEVPDARFVILGEGELREPLEHLVKTHHLEKHVLLPGFRTDVFGCIKGFDLFAMSSVTEGLGTSLLDAMACARPIVATHAGGIPEIVEDGVNGLLVPPRDHAAMAAAIVRLLKDAASRRRMGEADWRACVNDSPSSGWSPRPPRSTRAWPAQAAQRTVLIRRPGRRPRTVLRRLKPHAFIIRCGRARSHASPDRRDRAGAAIAVMSRAIGQPGLV